MKSTFRFIIGSYTVVVLALAALPAQGTLLFDNGQVNNYSGTDTSGADVKDSTAGDPTTLNVLSGATLGVTQVFDSSVLNVQAGATFVNTISGQDTSSVNVFGGDIFQVDLLNQSVGDISGGAFSCGGRCVGLFDTAEVSISGGVFGNSGGISILAQEESTAMITGGTFQGDVRAANDSSVDILGGNLSEVTATENAVITFFGDDFIALEGGIPVLTGFGEIIDSFNGTITGTLADDTPLDITALNGVVSSKIVLAPASTPPPGYSSVANAEAAAYGARSLKSSGSTNAMGLTLFPAGAIILIKLFIRRRRE